MAYEIAEGSSKVLPSLLSLASFIVAPEMFLPLSFPSSPPATFLRAAVINISRERRLVLTDDRPAPPRRLARLPL